MVVLVNSKKEKLSPSEASYRALSILDWIPKKKSIFIKPNIGATSKWVNTDPEIVRGIIHYLRDLGIKDITMGDGSVETEYESTPYNFHYGGWDRLAEKEKVNLIDLNRTERAEIPWYYGKLSLPKVLFNKTYINVAKLKTHMQTLVSLCAKNQKGLLNSSTRKEFHRLGLHKPIVELAKAVKSDLCVVDGIIAVEGDGPGELGTRRNLDIVVAGTNLIEVDRTCCKIMGIDPFEVEHLKILSLTKDFIDIPLSFEANPPFQRPSREFKMFNVHMRPENARSACQSSVGKMNKLARKSLKGIWHFFRNGVLSRFDIVIGSPEELPEGHGKIIFYGDCTKKIAKKHPEYPWFRGCPPVSKEVLEKLK